MRNKLLIFCTTLLLSFCFSNCEKENKCKDTVCLNGGACKDGTCICPTGYNGAMCQDRSPCLGVVCQNGGTCNNGTCACPSGYSGTNCETPTGQVVLYSFDNCGCGPINVTINGVTKTTTYFSNAALLPTCTTTTAAVFDLPPGGYNYTANCSTKTWTGSVTVLQGLCTRKEIFCADGITPKGSAMFWSKNNCSCGTIQVTCNGSTKSITSFPSSAPSCGTSGSGTFTNLPVGTHNYTASCSGKTWSGSVDVATNLCTKEELVCATPQTGTVTFWTDRNYGCGYIDVTLAGQMQTITGYYSGGVTSCGRASCATFTLPVGTYSYHGECSLYVWNRTIVVTANGCTLEKL
jgi:EGF-like domain